MRHARGLRQIAFAAFLGVTAGLQPNAAAPKKNAANESPPYTIMVALDMSAPFVGDGRMSFAALAFSATFNSVLFRWDPRIGCQVRADAGKLLLTRREFNDVQDDDDRHRPWLEKKWPMEFEAELSLSNDPIVPLRPPGRARVDGDDIPVVPLVPQNVRLHFLARFGLVDLQWYSKIGSNALSNMPLEFEVPWQNLMSGKPVTIKAPYEGDPEEKGTWWIEFLPQKRQP